MEEDLSDLQKLEQDASSNIESIRAAVPVSSRKQRIHHWFVKIDLQHFSDVVFNSIASFLQRETS
eukprot:jgi/Pico_ML_1/52991/g3615.t1